MWSSSDHRRCCRRREVTVPCSASWSRCWAASARSSWSRRWAARLQAVRAAASSRPGCSCSPPSASSSSSSTGSGSSARRRSPGPARSTSATSAPSGRSPATPPRSSERRCSGSTPTRAALPALADGAVAGLGAHRHRRAVPPRAVRRVQPAALAGARPAGLGCRSTRSTRPPPPPCHRLLAVHRVQPSLPAVVDLRAFDRIEVCGPDVEARALARAIICSAATFQSPEHLAIAVLASEESLAEWDWVKWLPHALSGQDSDAVGPRRMVSTSLAELASLLPSHAHVLVVVDGAELPPGHHGMTVLDLPSRWDELADSSRLRLLFEDDGEVDDGRPVISALRLREPPVRAAADQCDLATAEAVARRLTPLHVVTRRRGRAGQRRRDHRTVGLHGPARARRRPPVRRVVGLAHPARARPAAGADRSRRRRGDGPPGPQGVGAAGHGAARAGDRRHRLRASRSSCARWSSGSP